MLKNKHLLISTTKENIAFLIEGFDFVVGEHTNTKNQSIPERAAITLARLNNYRIFNPIIGAVIAYKEIFMELFKGADEFKQKLLIKSFIDFRKSIPEKSYELATKYNIILDPKKILQICVENGAMNEIPKWADGLSEDTLTIFETYILNEMQATLGSHQAEFKNKLTQEIIFTSNKLSFLNLLNFLKENPAIKIIFGMIGSLHLAIADYFNKIITQEIDLLRDGYIHAELEIENRIVEFHLFGASHEERKDYESFLKCVKDVLPSIMPINNSQLNSFFAGSAPMAYLQDQQLLRTARRLLDRDDYPEDYAKIFPDVSKHRDEVLKVLSNLKTKPLSAQDRLSLQEFIASFQSDLDVENQANLSNSVCLKKF